LRARASLTWRAAALAACAAIAPASGTHLRAPGEQHGTLPRRQQLRPDGHRHHGWQKPHAVSSSRHRRRGVPLMRLRGHRRHVLPGQRRSDEPPRSHARRRWTTSSPSPAETGIAAHCASTARPGLGQNPSWANSAMEARSPHHPDARHISSRSPSAAAAAKLPTLRAT
jgi:hypothetical protein